MSPRISAIIITLNEQTTIEDLLSSTEIRQADEIVVADGGSTDRTCEIARCHARVVSTTPSRAGQLNAGARAASGDVLLFLHADILLDGGAIAAIREAMANPHCVGGNLDIRFDGGDWVAATFDFIYHWRRYVGIFYGDSGIFCRRNVFDSLGGFPDFPILEDYIFARRLWKAGRLALLNAVIRVSDRRWRKAGLVRTMVAWVWIQAWYVLGVSPHRLARWYRHVR